MLHLWFPKWNLNAIFHTFIIMGNTIVHTTHKHHLVPFLSICVFGDSFSVIFYFCLLILSYFLVGMATMPILSGETLFFTKISYHRNVSLAVFLPILSFSFCQKKICICIIIVTYWSKQYGSHLVHRSQKKAHAFTKIWTRDPYPLSRSRMYKCSRPLGYGPFLWLTQKFSLEILA